MRSVGGVARWWPLVAAILLLGGLAGCAGARAGADGPPEIVYGEDTCHQCGMIISDERFAAGLVIEIEPGVSEHRVFDDIGELLLYEQEHAGELTITHRFVHDFESREWIDGATAYYVRSETLQSPMGHGIAASGDRARAEALARAWGGRVLDLDALRGEIGGTGVAGHRHP